mmetsp:Transcript_3064/g.3383  ORF Transcript_3064/g.3383 Transcript_3064/m.3383 type:complete len:165 (-) Transcript_3064:10-504(-)
MSNDPFIHIPRVASYPKTTSVFGIRLTKTTTLFRGGTHDDSFSTRIESKPMQVGFRFVSSFFLGLTPNQSTRETTFSYTHTKTTSRRFSCRVLYPFFWTPLERTGDVGHEPNQHTNRKQNRVFIAYPATMLLVEHPAKERRRTGRSGKLKLKCIFANSTCTLKL